MANPTIGIDVTARLDSLNAELNKIGPLGGKAAKDLVTQLSREIKAATKPAKETASALNQMGESAGKVGGAAKKLRGGLDSLIPGMGSLLGVVDDVGDAFEVAAQAGAGVGVGLGVLGIAIGAAAVAWQGLAGQEAEEAAVAKEVAAAHASVESILTDGRAAVLAYEVATGALSKTEAELSANADKAAASLAAAISGPVARLKELRTAQDSVKTQMVDLVGTYVQATDIFGITQDVYDGLTTSSADLADEQSRLVVEVNAAAAAAKENKIVTDLTIKAEGDAKEAVKGHAKAVDELANSIKAEQDAELAATNARGEAYLKEEKERQRLADLSRELTQKKIDDATALDKKLSDDADAERERNEQAAQEKRDQLAAEVDGALGAASESLAIVGQFADMEVEKRASTIDRLQKELTDGEDTLTAGQKKALKQRIAAQKKGAREAFAVAQAAKLAEAVVSTAASAISAYNDGLSVGGPAGLILGPVMAGVALAAGAVQIAAIANEKPTFHAGGLLPDEVPITARTGEAMLSGQGRAAIGDDVINAANDGRPPPGGMTMTTVYKHKSFDYFIADNLRGGGPLPQRIGRNERVGHLRRGN